MDVALPEQKQCGGFRSSSGLAIMGSGSSNELAIVGSGSSNELAIMGSGSSNELGNAIMGSGSCNELANIGKENAPLPSYLASKTGSFIFSSCNTVNINFNNYTRPAKYNLYHSS